MKVVIARFVFFCASIICLSSCIPPEGVSVPVITSFSPIEGKYETLITISGLNFSSTGQNDVRINGFPCSIISQTTTQIVIKVVPGVSSGKISVTVNNLAALSSKDFTLTPQQFTFDPRQGAVGDTINFSGTNFSKNSSDVSVLFYDSVVAVVTKYVAIDDGVSSFKTVVPDSAKTGKILIKVGAISVSSDSTFTVNP